MTLRRAPANDQVMLRYLSILIVVGVCGGCASTPRITYVAGGANLALGRTAYETAVALDAPTRGPWGRASTGIRVEDVTTFSEMIYDDQSFFDAFGGSYYHASFSIREGVQVR